MNKPIDLQPTIRDGFSKRLIIALKKNGHTSTRSHSGVSAKAIAKAIGCSFTIARKYIAGKSLPENKTMEKLSNWLNVDIWWLLYGNKEQTIKQHLDKDLLNDIFLEAKDLLINYQQKWEYIINNIFEIYDSISELEGTKENKKNSIKLMINFLTNSLETI